MSEASIASRTRTKVSLVDVDIEQLEGDLADDPSYLGLNMDIIEEEENYRRFLTSLVPNGDDDLSFLCEEDDEEYHPHEEDDEDDEEEDEARNRQQMDLTNSISKAELSGLLWDSSNIDIIPGSNEAKAPTEVQSKAAPLTFRQIQPNGHSKGSLNKAQLTQLASQMHKHYQLLCQMSLLAEVPNPETQNMLEDLRRRGEAVRAWKESVVAKVNPSESPTTVLNSRRVTRAFSAAHAAIVNPSMYEIHALHKRLEYLAIEPNERTDQLRTHLGALDYHLIHSTNCSDKIISAEEFTESEDRLLVHGVKRSGAKITWSAIQKNFLPTKSTENLRARYRFLSSSKAPQNPVKAFISSFPPRRIAPWLIEEEIRILRGMLAFGEDERRKFSKIATQLLPHRSRNEIRKKWGRMQVEMAAEETLGIENLTPREKDIVRWQKALEKKLAIKETTSLNAMAPKTTEIDEKNVSGLKDDSIPIQCLKKHLHPALFYSPWAIITPSVLLDTTCEHNWPASLPLKSKKRQTKPQVDDSPDAWASMTFPSDDDDSEFELEELLSSDEEDDEEETKTGAEEAQDLSDMDFEQVELEDDDDEDNDDMLFDYEIDPPRQFPLALTSKRTLAALERRISGAPSHALSDTHSPLSHFNDNDIEIEELEDDNSDDDEFECEELLPSSDDEDDHHNDIAAISNTHKIDSARLELLTKRMSQRDG